MKEKVRIAGGQGFWGDLLSAPVDQVRNGPIDYLMLDYLAEVTMSILQKQRNRDSESGYARDFVSLMREILPDCVEKDIKVLSNAGGVNVLGCASAIRDAARELGLQGKVKIGVVTGDDVLDQLDTFLANGVEINSMDDGGSLLSGWMTATKLLVVPRSIPTIISACCRLPVAILIAILAMGIRITKYEVRKPV